MEDISNKGFCIFGQRGTGKSVLTKHLLASESNSIVYDILKEHQGFNRYIPSHRQVKLPDHSRDPAILELNNFVNRIVIGSRAIRLFILEEANRYCPPKPKPLPQSILDLNDFLRHQRISFGCVARRPVQLNSDITELAHYLFIFRLAGRNDIQYLEDIAEGLGEAVKNLPEYHFIVVPQDRARFYIHKPVPYEK